MALTITKNWDDGTALTESQLDDIKTSLETFVNTTKLDSNSIQTGGISSANLASGAVTAAKIDSSAVTTAKIASGAVTQAKRAALGQQVSSTCSNFTSTSTSYTDVTNLSVSITTTGRPVFIGLISDGSSNAAELGALANASIDNPNIFIKILRDATVVGIHFFGLTEASASSNLKLEIPSSSIWAIDVPSAGTYTYKVQVKCNTSTLAAVYYSKLVAYEL